MIPFPPNVKNDVDLGIVQWRHLRIIIPALAAGVILFLLWPGGFAGRFLAGAAVAGGGFLFAVLDGPTRLRIGRAYRRRPRERAPFREERIEDWLAGVSLNGSGRIGLPDGSLAAALELSPPPWVLLSEEERTLTGRAFETAAEQALLAGIEVRWIIESTADLARQEFERQRRLARQAPPGLARIILARAAHHEALGRQGKALRCPAYLILTARPGSRQEERLEQALADAEAALRQARIGTARLGPEAVRDLAWRQLCPADHERSEPPVGVEWIRAPRTSAPGSEEERQAGQSTGIRIRL